MIKRNGVRTTLLMGFMVFFIAPSIANANDDEKSDKLGWSAVAAYTGDLLANTHGGLKTGEAYNGLGQLELNYTADHWSMHSNAYIAPHGAGITDHYAGDFSVASNIDMPGSSRLQELWVQRTFDNASLRFGMLAADTEFWGSEYGGLFINSAFGAPSIVSANLPGPSIFPVATLGVRWDRQLTDTQTVRVAVLDGDAGDPETNNRHGFNIHLNEGALLLAEWQWQLRENGTLKLSSYHHTDTFMREDGSTRHGTWGGLVVIDYPLSEKLGWFGRFGYATESVSHSPWSFETGINIKNIFDSPATLGVGFANVDLNARLFHHDDPLANLHRESIFEATLDYPINDWFTVQPDIQYIAQPGGDPSQKDALVIGIRLRFSHDFHAADGNR